MVPSEPLVSDSIFIPLHGLPENSCGRDGKREEKWMQTFYLGSMVMLSSVVGEHAEGL